MARRASASRSLVGSAPSRWLTRPGSVWRIATFAIALSTVVSACAVSGQQFVQDRRVRFVEPSDRARVTLPVTLRWQVEGFTVAGRDGRRARDAGYFAIFVDRPPMPPGRTLEWMAEQKDSCGNSACGTVDRLTDAYTTNERSLTLTRLPADARRGAVERHEAVLVLLDGTGARIGESAFYVRFRYDRAG